MMTAQWLSGLRSMLLLLQDSLRYGIIGKATIPMPVSAVYEKDIVLNDNIEQAGFIWTDVSLLLRSDTK